MSKIKICFVRKITASKPVRKDKDFVRSLTVLDKNNEKLVLEFRGDQKKDVLISGLN